jgi:hypothetical protein
MAQDTPEEPRQTASSARLVRLLAAVLGCVLVVSVIMVAGPLPLSRVGTLVLLAAGAFAVGALLGFLFGIPRSVQADPQPGDEVARSRRKFSANTNLEQISDWLTKILVGVGLIELGRLAAAANDLTTSIGLAVTPGPVGRVAAGAILVTFAAVGFLVSYVGTRTGLTHLFEQYEINRLVLAVDSVHDEVQEIRSIVATQLAERLEQDKAAMRLAMRQIDPGEPEVEFAVLREAFENASPSELVHILVLAEDVRRRVWRSPEYKTQLTRTGAVFKALAEVEPDSHRYWANLGFVLKDQHAPDTTGAIEALNKSIEIRGDVATAGKELYELTRAILRLRQLRDDRPDPDIERLISRDVELAWRSEAVRRRIERSLAIPLNVADFADQEIHRLAPYLPGNRAGAPDRSPRRNR